MEQQKTPPVMPQAPMKPLTLNARKKLSGTNLIVLALIAAAIVFTGLAYVLTSQKNPTKQFTVNNPSAITPTPSATRSEDAKWKQYFNIKNNYSFYYPATWDLTQSTNDPSEFTLNYPDPQMPATIKGKLLSKAEQDKTFICEHLDPDKQVCKSYNLTANTKAYMEINLKDNVQTTATALVSRPNQVMLYFTISKENFDSYHTLAIMLDTLRFKGEAPSNKIQICPDSWSANKDTATYNGATFPVAEVDLDYIKTDCK